MDLSKGIEGITLELKPLREIGVDGVHHINTYKNTARTKMGGLLDRAASVEVHHPSLGKFSKALNFYSYITHKDHDDSLRVCDFSAIKNYKGEMSADKNTKSLMVECLYYKIQGNKKLHDWLMDNSLPMDYYWVGRGHRLLQRPANSKGIIAPIEIAIEIIKQELDIDKFSSMNNRDIYSSFVRSK